MGGRPPASALASTSTLNDSLTRLGNKAKISKRISDRIEIIKRSISGVSISDTVRQTGKARETVRLTRHRWQAAYDDLVKQAKLYEAGEISRAKFDLFVESTLHDQPRCGRAKLFTRAQEEQIVALGTENPIDYGIPVEEWTNKLLAQVAIAHKVVESISVSQVRRILKKSPSTSS